MQYKQLLLGKIWNKKLAKAIQKVEGDLWKNEGKNSVSLQCFLLTQIMSFLLCQLLFLHSRCKNTVDNSVETLDNFRKSPGKTAISLWITLWKLWITGQQVDRCYFYVNFLLFLRGSK